METSQYLDIFIDESMEHLDMLYQQLLELEKNPKEKEIIEEIFRAAHTLKGMSATMEFDDLAGLTHKLENIFDGIRDDKIVVQTEMMDSLFHAVDHLNAMVEDISNGGNGKRDVEEIISQLDLIEKGESAIVTSKKEKKEDKVNSNTIDDLDEFQLTILGESKDRGFDNYEIEVHLREDCLLKGARVYMVFELLEKSGEVIHSNPTVNDLEEENFDFSFSIMFVTKEDPQELQAKIMKVSEVEQVNITPFSIEDYKEVQDKIQEQVTEVKPEKDNNRESKKADNNTKMQQTGKGAQSKTIRVNIERLDILMNLFEELVIDRGRLEQISSDLNHYELQETVERMSRVSSDLQNIILTMRMVPIDTVFNRFPRMIRQLARDLGKEVEIEVIGAETELDRTVIDEIGDPLVHLIRNAMDHGIETPSRRAELGKPEQGKIILEAYHSGNHVFVEISDDGSGINKEKVKNKAIEKGVISSSEAELLTDQQIFELILASGFSTNEEISDVSGRGVGLDVVKNTIESLGGSISIDAIPGEGSTFSIQLPLTLSIISVLLVELQNEKYAIPLSSIIETAILKKKDIFSAHHNKVIDFRGKVIPLTFLNKIFDVPHEEDEEDEYVSIVIVRKGNKVAGLVVDSFIGQQEVVLKSLGNYLTNVFAISGATILGDGEVALIIDSNALVK
ncbi:chemotaxis protein CheA [Pseudogracilibacillus sp. SE30717A]|uniref:chemotaxis protein CheA n=1 Tax=Pseudogracilibacillus sp. SE30717A TaxID=3098293 RepID=UPI00300E5315